MKIFPGNHIHQWPLFLLGYCILMPGYSVQSQVVVSGQASTAFVRSSEDTSQYAYNGGRGTFNWRLDLFTDAILTDGVMFHGTARMMQDQTLHIDLFSLQAVDVTPLHLTFEAGEVEIPLGSLGERKYPMKNPFNALPLMHEHYTTLRNSDLQLWPLDGRYTAAGNGVRLLDQGLYDLGAKVSGSAGMFDFTAAIINGTISRTSAYGGQGLSPGNDLGEVVRAAVTPITGLNFGVSYAYGVLTNSYTVNGYQTSTGTTTIPQHILEGDIAYSTGHMILNGEAVYNIWQAGDYYHNNMTAFGYSVEGEYAILPRLSAAARAGGLFFNSIEADLPVGLYNVVSYQGRWDLNVLRLEGALRYRFTRDMEIKLVYQWTDTPDRQTDSNSDLIALQAVLNF